MAAKIDLCIDINDLCINCNIAKVFSCPRQLYRGQSHRRTRCRRCPLSSVICLLSYVLCPLSYVLCHLSYVLCSTMSFVVLCPLSHVLCPMWHLWCFCVTTERFLKKLAPAVVRWGERERALKFVLRNWSWAVVSYTPIVWYTQVRSIWQGPRTVTILEV